MATSDFGDIVAQKARELAARSTQDAWGACAAIWGRVFVLAENGWRRWPRILPMVQEAMTVSMRRAISPESRLGAADVSHLDFLLARLEAFDVDDDGSADWQYVVDIVSMLGAAAECQPHECAEYAVRTYLEGIFNVLANKYADAAGRPISQTEAEARFSGDPEWDVAVNFIISL